MNRKRSHSPLVIITTIFLVLAWLYITGLNFSHKDEVLRTLQQKGGYFSVPNWVNDLMWYVTTAFWALLIFYVISCTSRTAKDFRSKECYLYEFGHIHWIVSGYAFAALIAHHYWQHFTITGNLAAATSAIIVSSTFMMVSLWTQIYYLERNVIALWRESLTLDIRVMYLVVIQAIDFYASWLSYLTLITIDSYLVSIGVNANTSNFYTMLLLIITMVVYPLLDMFVFDQWLHYLLGGYLAFALGPLGTLLYQMRTMQNIPFISMIAGLMLFILPPVKLFTVLTNYQNTESGFKIYS